MLMTERQWSTVQYLVLVFELLNRPKLQQAQIGQLLHVLMEREDVPTKDTI